MAVARRVVAVVGPTATGKSALAIAMAQALGGEVVNADSMQLYRGMDIGTAKVGIDERAGVAHHLLDIWPVTYPASVAEYQQRARAVIDELHGRGVVPVLVGGSGLYVRAALDRIDFPGTDPELRAGLEAELAAAGAKALHERLAQRDPAAAAAILPSNGRRIVRALEVVELTGRPFTAALPSYDAQENALYDVVPVGLDLDDEMLDLRVDVRVGRMFASGLVEEVRDLADRQGLREGRTASRALGYQQVLAMLDGAISEEEAIASTAAATRRFVRRQRSWFRRDPRIRWLDAAAPDLAARAAALATAEN
ncbi:MAG: tRNA (adenosine(37)-N6)-dimethylallyltransferase MiaA [Frankiaceae bacterium]|nr:tRNA (adenosine(37)-N6)-dimethylallyltransferase MiaA [Frankiaceae bacterium]MBV9369151.1 tRNA (adenosine(37)-N6)-dimethylallyltransferase MiaA [Frankiales bacterium]